MSKHYDVRLPNTWCGQDLGLPFDPEVRAFLTGFSKNEYLAIADEYDRRVADTPKPGENRLENDILASIGEMADSVEVEVEYVDVPIPVIDAEKEDEGVPVPVAPAVLETREVAPDESDNYDECDRDDLYKEARRRKLSGIAPKIGKVELMKHLRRDDAKNL